MKINLAKSAGFCFGVRRALKIAFETAKSDASIEMLSDIVHNEDVVKEIEKSGIRKIKRLQEGKNKTLLLSAHGTPLATLKKAHKFGYKIVDATCPMVKVIHRLAIESEQKGYMIIVIGDKEHDEVRGIVGQLKKRAIIIDNIKNIPINKIKKNKKVTVVVQSTQEMTKTLAIVDVLKQHIKELKFFNTICQPTRIKQEEIKIMPLNNDIMIIIGSKNSANTKRLYEIAKSLNNRSFWIQSKDEIKSGWFRDVENVGIAAGASTPDTTTEEVIEYIRKIT